MDLEEMRRRVAAARVGHLATQGAHGPHLVPITLALAGGIIYSTIDNKPKSGSPLRRLENIRSFPRVAVLVDHYEEDWKRLWWIRVDGEARILQTGEGFEAGRAALVAKYEQYRADVPAGPVIAVEPSHWAHWQGSSSRA